MTLASCINRRIQICNEIADIEKMRKGNLNEFYNNEKLKDGTIARRGPFYSLTSKGANGKTITKSVSKNDLDEVREQVGNYKRFRGLSDEYIEVCESISMLSKSDDEAKKN